MAAGYEFSAAENTVISDLGKTIRFVAVCQALAGAVFVFAGVAMLGSGQNGAVVVLEGQGVLNVLVSVFMLGAARRFDLVATTRGKDVAHMMTALGQLRKMYDVQRMLVALTILAFAAGLAASFMGAGR